MKLLLDTHTLIWALCEPEKLCDKAIQLIAEPNNIIYVSTASLWELQIKKSIGKISLPASFASELQASGYEFLNITPNHIAELENIPLIHRDPFDRVLISQSKFEGLPLATRDSEILKYDIDLIQI